MKFYLEIELHFDFTYEYKDLLRHKLYLSTTIRPGLSILF